MTDTLTLTIDPPILVAGESYATLELREPTSKQVRVANGELQRGNNPMTAYMRNAKLISLVSGWPTPAVDLIPDGPFTKASMFLMGFSERAEREMNMEALARAMEEQATKENQPGT